MAQERRRKKWREVRNTTSSAGTIPLTGIVFVPLHAKYQTSEKTLAKFWIQKKTYALSHTACDVRSFRRSKSKLALMGGDCQGEDASVWRWGLCIATRWSCLARVVFIYSSLIFLHSCFI